MNNLVIVNIHWAIKAAANIIFTFLPAHVTCKIHFHSDNGAKFFETFMDKDHLEKKFGGNVPNLEQDFFPPRYNTLKLDAGLL